MNYHSHAEVLRDIRILQARGVKVLMNVDDAPSWSTSTPFTTYDAKKLTAQEFAAFIKACAIDSVQLDGISLAHSLPIARHRSIRRLSMPEELRVPS